MNGHLSARQIEEWVLGERTEEVERHLAVCDACTQEVQQIAGPLAMFGHAVRDWAGRPADPPVRVLGWRLALVAAMLLMTLAAPIYRRGAIAKREAAEATAAHDEMLLRDVQAGLSRSVPAPMEPLARLMSGDLRRGQ